MNNFCRSNIVNIVNKYYILKIAKKVDLKYSHHKKEMELCDLMVLANCIVVVVYNIWVSNQDIAHLKLIQSHMSVISQ